MLLLLCAGALTTRGWQAHLHVACVFEQLAQHVCCCSALRKLLLVQALYVHLRAHKHTHGMSPLSSAPVLCSTGGSMQQLLQWRSAVAETACAAMTGLDRLLQSLICPALTFKHMQLNCSTAIELTTNS
jgi:hypothetical protein